MIKDGIQSLAGKHILLLQGPVGPFFKTLSEALKKNSSVVKVNFNGGDLLFYPGAQYNFKGRLNEWNKFLENIATSLKPLTFFNIWAQKEAFIKAIGLGLSYPTSNMTVPLLQYDHQNIINPIDDISWKITSFYPMPLYAAAICYHPSVENIYYGCI
jgi:hypothetical protein